MDEATPEKRKWSRSPKRQRPLTPQERNAIAGSKQGNADEQHQTRPITLAKMPWDHLDTELDA